MTVNGLKRSHHVDPRGGLDDLFYRVGPAKHRLYVLGLMKNPHLEINLHRFLFIFSKRELNAR